MIRQIINPILDVHPTAPSILPDQDARGWERREDSIVEIWKPIERFGDMYEVSSLGRIRSYRRHGKSKNLNSVAKIIGGTDHGNGYRTVTLLPRGCDGVRYTYIHREVALAFIGPCPSGKTVNHINSIRDDNRVENLEYVTPSENTQHAIRMGRQRPFPPPQLGETNNRARLTDEIVREMRMMYSKRLASPKMLAQRFGVSDGAALLAIAGSTWAHVQNPGPVIPMRRFYRKYLAVVPLAQTAPLIPGVVGPPSHP